MPETLRICQVASEYAPFAKTGGLADVLGALCPCLHDLGHDVRAFLPLYSQIERHHLALARVPALQDVPLALGEHEFRFSVVAGEQPGTNLTVYFVDCPELFQRSALYTSDPDEHLRFLLLTRAAIESCQRLAFSPHVFHCHDWHSAFAPLYLRSIYAWDRLFAGARTVLTIHNIGFQGTIPASAVGDLGLRTVSHMLHQDDLKQGWINALRHGILYADGITTVSPTHAQEICTPEYGMGLDGDLRGRRQSLIGILNGIDPRQWNPANDPYLVHHFDRRRLSGKTKTKAALLARLALKPAPKAPLIGMVSRMTRQKGFDLLFATLPRFLAERDMRLAVVGDGEARYAEFFTGLRQRFPTKVAFHLGYHEELAHLIEAGSDMFLMPSLYEPCGLNQMYSQRYGTVPIVRRTGGLADSVRHFDPQTGTGTGIVFEDFDDAAIAWAIGTALEWYRDKPLWKRLMLNAMAQDFSWDKQAALYVAFYRRLLQSA